LITRGFPFHGCTISFSVRFFSLLINEVIEAPTISLGKVCREDRGPVLFCQTILRAPNFPSSQSLTPWQMPPFHPLTWISPAPNPPFGYPEVPPAQRVRSNSSPHPSLEKYVRSHPSFLKEAALFWCRCDFFYRYAPNDRRCRLFFP